MPPPSPVAIQVLTLNAGSSSIKFALYSNAQELTKTLSGKIERIGLSGTTLAFKSQASTSEEKIDVQALDVVAAGKVLIDWLGQKFDFKTLKAIGHRVVHGGAKYSEPQIIDDAVLTELKRISPYDPEHMPAEIALIEACRQQHPELKQVACFDTAFHHSMPRVAKILPIPRKYEALGVQRYGFHGLSYTYLMEELERVAGREAAHGRIILAHLGNGCSMAAVKGGRSIDTSMAFTPTAGLVMSTRTGDLDPGLVSFLARTENMTPEQFHTMVNHESGLRGVSETSSDMRDLEAHQSTDPRAAEAVELFCYSAQKWIGAYAAALGGLDTLIFAGGIGEHGSTIRARICQNLAFLGIELDLEKNAGHDAIISNGNRSVTVRVIPTDEEVVIAKAVFEID